MKPTFNVSQKYKKVSKIPFFIPLYFYKSKKSVIFATILYVYTNYYNYEKD